MCENTNVAGRQGRVRSQTVAKSPSLIDKLVRHQSRGQGRQRRPALFGLRGSRRRRRRKGPCRFRKWQGAGSPRSYPQGDRGRETRDLIRVPLREGRTLHHDVKRTVRRRTRRAFERRLPGTGIICWRSDAGRFRDHGRAGRGGEIHRFCQSLQYDKGNFSMLWVIACQSALRSPRSAAASRSARSSRVVRSRRVASQQPTGDRLMAAEIEEGDRSGHADRQPDRPKEGSEGRR